MAAEPTPSRRWLVTGGSGQVGTALAEAALPSGVELILPVRSALDLSRAPDFDAALAATGAELLINCAAYTAVDRAECEPNLAMAINGHAPAAMADAAARAGIPMLHISTDYVFDGRLQGRAYAEDDAVAPINTYGRTKLAGEQAVMASAARAVVLRTAWVLSPFGANFLKTMLRLGAERDTLGVVSDQVGSPTSALDIADTLARIGDALVANEAAPTGLFHFVNDGWTSWHGLAAHIFERAAAYGRPKPELSAIATADYPTSAARPANSRLDTGRIAADYDIVPRSWQEAVDEIVDRLCAPSTRNRGSR